MANRTFNISYSPFNRKLLGLLGMGPKFSRVTVSDDFVDVRMGWGFRGSIPRAQIVSATRAKKPWLAGWGVHGLLGNWTVNGSDDGIVELTVSPSVNARTIVFALTIKKLYVSLEDPDGFLAALTS